MIYVNVVFILGRRLDTRTKLRCIVKKIIWKTYGKIFLIEKMNVI